MPSFPGNQPGAWGRSWQAGCWVALPRKRPGSPRGLPSPDPTNARAAHAGRLSPAGPARWGAWPWMGGRQGSWLPLAVRPRACVRAAQGSSALQPNFREAEGTGAPAGLGAVLAPDPEMSAQAGGWAGGGLGPILGVSAGPLPKLGSSSRGLGTSSPGPSAPPPTGPSPASGSDSSHTCLLRNTTGIPAGRIRSAFSTPAVAGAQGVLVQSPARQPPQTHPPPRRPAPAACSPATEWGRRLQGLSLRGETHRGACALSMKVFLPVVLAVLLGVERAHCLVCFSCTNQNSNFYCLKPTICSDSDNYCVTVSAAAGIGNVVDFGHSLNKGCSPVCPAPPNINVGVASMGTYCCQSFLCNISAADGGPRASRAMLGLGLLLSLLSALLRLGP